MIGRTNVGGGGGGQTWSIRGWCNTVGLSYGLLDAITEADMRTLMTKYASVAYFREWYSNEPDMIDDFIANAYAMKWIGLRDYICDKLMAVADFKTKALASDNWEYILKDHVPVMTSNTAPYGEVLSSEKSYRQGFEAFDGDSTTIWRKNESSISDGHLGYRFTSPMDVRKIAFHCNSNSYGFSVTIQYSDDGSSWEDATSFTAQWISESTSQIVSINESQGYHLYWRAYFTTSTPHYFIIRTIQFYGRSLNISVPKMTGNTSPYGVASATSNYSGRSPYMAFNASESSWLSANGSPTNQRIAYKFTRPICVKKLHINFSGEQYLENFKLQGSNDGTTWVDITPTIQRTGMSYSGDVNNSNNYMYYGLLCNTTQASYVALSYIQFFGVDYSERTDRTYLYDHGVEVVPMTKTSSSALSSVNVSTKSLLRAMVGSHATTTDRLACGTAYAVANNLPNGFVLDIVNITGTQSTGFSVINGSYLNETELWME